MSLRLTVGDAKALEEGVWFAELTPAEVCRFGNAKNSFGAISVVGVAQPDFDPQRLELTLNPNDALVLNIGASNRTLIVDIGGRDTLQMPSKAGTRAYQSGLRQPSDKRKGDRAFLAECRKHLDASLVAIVEELLSRIRERYPGELHEGKARKWVNYPDNFVALTIQNRDKSFAVHVKGYPDQFSALSLDIKSDRPGYCRFKLKSKDQLDDTIRVVLASARNTVRR